MSGGFNFPWISTPFPGGTSLRGKFPQWGGFPFIHTYGLGGFFPWTSFGNTFPLGSTHTPRGTPSLGRNHAPGSSTIPGGTQSYGTPQPSNITNVRGPKGSSGTSRTSSSS
jgi:hypothetical protein